MRIAVSLALAIAIIACTSSTPDVASLRDREWTLTHLADFAALPATGAPTIRFGEDGRVSANTGCNSAGTTYTVEGDRLGLGIVSSTRRACAQRERNQMEHAFLRALERVDRFRISDQQLELLAADGSVVARFRAATK